MMTPARRTNSTSRTNTTKAHATVPSTTTTTAHHSQRYWSRSSPVERRHRAAITSKATNRPASSNGYKLLGVGIATCAGTGSGSANGLGM